MQALILASLLITSNAYSDNQSSSYLQGRLDASLVSFSVHDKYLACYALNEVAKKQCTDDLALKHINIKWQQDKEYVKAFQFESERLGFKHFLENLFLPCQAVNEGPIFVLDQEAYFVKCTPDGKYFMEFDTKTKAWKLIK